MKTVKVHVFRYIGGYGDGLVFTDDVEDLEKYKAYYEGHKYLGEFDLPLDFLEKLGCNNENRTKLRM